MKYSIPSFLFTVFLMVFLLASCDKEVITIDPVINSVDRLIYQSGDTIQITGENFSRHNSNNLIQFKGGVEANSISWSNGNEDTLTAIIPQGAQSGNFTLKVYDKTVTYTDIVYFIEGGKFEKLNSAPINFSEAFSFNFNNKLYIGGGVNENGPNNTFWEFNPESNIWNKKAPHPENYIRHAFSFETDGKIFVGGGFYDGRDCTGKLYEYNPQQDIWIMKKDFPPSIKNRCDCFGISNESTAYIACKSHTRNIIVYKYNPTEDSWLEMYSEEVDGVYDNSKLKGAYRSSNKIYLVCYLDFSLYGNNDGFYLAEFDLETSQVTLLNIQNDNIFESDTNNDSYDIHANYGYNTSFFSFGGNGYLVNKFDTGRKIWRHKAGDSKLDLFSLFNVEAYGSSIISNDKSAYIIGGFVGDNRFTNEVWKFTP